MAIQIKLPKPYEHQERLLARCGRNNLLLLGRRYGKTTIMSAVLKERAITRSGYRGAYSAPTWKLMIEAFEEAKDTLAPVISRVNREDRRIEIKNGTTQKSVLEFWSSDDPASGRGRRYHDWVSDETQRQKRLRQFIVGSVMPTLADWGGNLYVLGTTNGEGSELHEFYLDCLSKPEEWFIGTGTTDDNPYISLEDKVKLRRDLADYAAQEMDSLWLKIDGVTPLVRQLVWETLFGQEDHGYFRKTLAVDASVSGDLTAIVAVWRNQSGHFFVDYDDIILLYPDPSTGEINYAQIDDIVEKRWATGLYSCVVYDPYQMVSSAQEWASKGINVYKFTQNTMRLHSDSFLKQMLNQGRFHHPNHPELTEHFTNATLKLGTGDSVRIIKPKEGSKVDLAVASSMATWVHNETVPTYAQNYLPVLSPAPSLLYTKNAPVTVDKSPWGDRTSIKELVKGIKR